MITSIEEGPMGEAELRELEGVIERHRGPESGNDPYGIFSWLCIPRLLTTIRHLQDELAQANRERDDALVLLRNLTG